MHIVQPVLRPDAGAPGHAVVDRLEQGGAMSIFAVLAQGMLAGEQVIQSRGVDLVNLQTPGYRRGQTGFGEALRAGLTGEMPPTPLADTIPGALLQTGRNLDVYLQPDIYMAVKTPTGDAWSRLGHLTQTTAGGLLDGHGQIVDLSGSLRAESAAVRIDADGTLWQGDDKTGALRLAQLTNPMTDADGYVRQAAEISPVADKTAALIPGGIEMSNVNYVDTIVDLFAQTRQLSGLQYAYQRIDSVYDQVMTDLGKF